MEGTRKRAGVLGGMGPEAALVFLEKFYALSRHQREQDRPPLLLDMDPTVPDRNQAWRNHDREPAAALAEMGRRLAQAGADFCVMPCATAHGFTGEFETAVGLPLLRMPEVVADSLAYAHGPASVGILATTTALEMELFQRALAAHDIDTVVPAPADQEALMEAIYLVKRGEDVEPQLAAIARRLVQQGADTLLVGCTDLSLVELTEASGHAVVDALDLLARRTLEETGAGGHLMLAARP